MRRLASLLLTTQFLRSFLIGALGFIFLLLPVWAQATPTAPIRVDGHQLFEVSQLGNYSAKNRIEEANAVLEAAIKSPQAPQVEVIKRNQLPVIRVDDGYLLTVTQEDALAGRTAEEQAEIWAQQIREAIQQARYQQSSTYIRSAWLLAASSVLVAIALHWFLGRIWNRWLRRFIPKEMNDPETGRLPEGIELLLQSTLNLGRAGMWLVTAVYISNLFPLSRLWSRRILDTLIGTLAAPVISLGEDSYSIVDLVVLIGLFLGLIILARSTKKLLRSRVLQVTKMSRGAQEAIAFLTNYGLIIVGTLVLLQLWGLDLSSLTILASVLGVGIGLGLQGIAKEFVSGLVIIFERPIQIGDFVEVGEELMGTVERISLRSTEIRTLDQVSIIVPNSHFLESEVVNWSHGSPVTRLKLPVGVAYGSNPSAVRSALIDAVKEHPDVLGDPVPRVWFKEFGDSSINFEVLVWISEPRKQFQIKSDLYFRIEAILRHRHVEIPFPQRDLHVRAGSLPVELSPKLEETLAELSEGFAAWLKHSINGGTQEKSKKANQGSCPTEEWDR